MTTVRTLLLCSALSLAFGGVSRAHGHHAHSDQPAHSFGAEAPLNGKVVLDQCWVRLLPAELPAAAYLKLRNESDAQVRVIGASSPDYGHVMLHESLEQGGMSRMQHTESIELKPGATLELKPGGYHVMLEKAHRPLASGQEIELSLLLSDGSRSTGRCELRPAGAQAY